MELMEELYKDDNIRSDCKMIEVYMDNYNQFPEPLFTKILHEFHICLGCSYTYWEDIVWHVYPSN